MITALLQITMGILVIRIVLSIIAATILGQKLQQAQKNNSSIDIRQYAQADQQNKTQTTEMVRDSICGKMIEKRKAYIVSSGNQMNYFCSWECRQKFIEEAGA